jgi:hypothetical protein
MIKEDIHKLLFLDIETVGGYSDLDDLHSEDKQLYEVWEDVGLPYFKRHYSDHVDEYSSYDYYEKYSALLPEFGRIVCVSVGFILPDGNSKVDSFYGDEHNILTELQKLLNRINGLGFSICGHNVKNFDLPYIGKRMLVNGIVVPTIIPNHNVKPWETKTLDTKEMWNFNSFKGLSSLQLVCACMGIKNPKGGTVKGSNMHDFYYNSDSGNSIEEIKNYCEDDVITTIELVKKVKEL